MAGKAGVQSGKDGQYRMIIEDRYKHMALARRAVRFVFPAYFVVGAAKLAWLVMPYVVDRGLLNPLYLASFCIAFLGGLIMWLAAGFGGRNERFVAVMLFNILTAMAISFHIATRFKYHITPPEKRGVADSKVVSMALIKLFPQLRSSSSTLLQVVDVAEVSIDIGFIVVGAALAIALHQYITEKKAARKEEGTAPKKVQ